jgi:hypothetical protein
VIQIDGQEVRGATFRHEVRGLLESPGKDIGFVAFEVDGHRDNSQTGDGDYTRSCIIQIIGDGRQSPKASRTAGASVTH